MNKIFTSITILLTTINCYSQNLVPNPQFEEYSSCNFGMGALDTCLNWFHIKPSPDYYNACIDSTYPGSFDIPTTFGGVQYSRSSNGMIGLFASERIYGSDAREYAHVQLTQPLDSGIRYYIQFYVNLMDSSHYAIKSMGAFLDDTLPLFCPSCWVQSRLIASPQVTYSGSSALSSTTDWTLVSGWYTSVNGGEKYLTIGNFSTDSLSGIENLLSSNNGRSYYYIEDVCISTDSIFCSNMIPSGITNELKLDVKIFPNPFTDRIVIESEIPNYPELNIYSIDGKKLYYSNNFKYETRIELDLSALKNGFYILTFNNGLNSVRKIIIKQ